MENGKAFGWNLMGVVEWLDIYDCAKDVIEVRERAIFVHMYR